MPAQQLEQLSCSWQDTSNEGARRLIQVLMQLDTSSESSKDNCDKESEADAEIDTSITGLPVYGVNESKSSTSNGNGKSRRRRIQPELFDFNVNQQHKEDYSSEESDQETCPKGKITGLANDEEVRLRKNKHEHEIMTYSQLEKKDLNKAKEVLELYNDKRRQRNVHLCDLFLRGKCGYFTKDFRQILNHMRSHKEKNIPLPLKIVNCPAYKDRKTHEYLVKTYSELKKNRPALAKKVLALYKEQKNKKKLNVHLCGFYLERKCEYFNTNPNHLRCHIASNH